MVRYCVNVSEILDKNDTNVRLCRKGKNRSQSCLRDVTIIIICYFSLLYKLGQNTLILSVADF